MARISQKTVDLITSTADIVDVISDYVELQPAGSGFKGLCPFHSEKTPSFSVSKEKGVFKCFGCGEAGGAVTFIQKYKNISYADALLALAEKYHIPVETEGDFTPVNDFSHLFEINEKASEIFQLTLTNLEKGKQALEYVTRRGLDIHTIQYFEIGYASNEVGGLYTQLKDSYEPVELMELGLIKKNDKEYIDLFRNRLMFPIHNEYGKTIGFSGRVIDQLSDVKYVNSPLTKLFIKGNALYNLDKALPFIKRENRVILFEGFFDVIAAFQAGIKEGVCSMGTALTDEQAKLLKKYTDHAVICYDGDKAGFEATSKAIPILRNAGLQVSIVLLPDKLDPDEFVKERSRNSFLQYVNTTQIDPFEFQYIYLTKQTDLTKPSMIEDLKLKVFNMLMKQNSDMLLEIYMKKMSEDLNVSYESLKSDLHHYQLTKAITFQTEQRKQKISTIKIINKKEESVRRLVAYYLYSDEYRKIIIDEIQKYFVNDRIYTKILFEADGFVEKNIIHNLREKVLSVMTGSDYEMAIRRLVDRDEEYSMEELKQLITTHKEIKIEMDILSLQETIKNANPPLSMKDHINTSNKIIELKKQIEELKKEKSWKKPKS